MSYGICAQSSIVLAQHCLEIKRKVRLFLPPHAKDVDAAGEYGIMTTGVIIRNLDSPPTAMAHYTMTGMV